MTVAYTYPENAWTNYYISILAMVELIRAPSKDRLRDLYLSKSKFIYIIFDVYVWVSPGSIPSFFNFLAASVKGGALTSFCFWLSIFLAVGLFSIVEFNVLFFLKSTAGPFVTGTYLVFEYFLFCSLELILGVFF